MPNLKPRRARLATALETSTPPASLPATNALARITRAAGNNLYEVLVPSSFSLPSSSCSSSSVAPNDGTTSLLVEMPRRFRSTIWVKRGSYVVVDVAALAGRENKLGGEIVNVVREEKRWRRMAYW